MNPGMRDIGVYHRVTDAWLVLAAAYVIPPSSQAPVLATRALQLVNEVRARGLTAASAPLASPCGDLVRNPGRGRAWTRLRHGRAQLF